MVQETRVQKIQGLADLVTVRRPILNCACCNTAIDM
jgi:hypothetical protein